MIFLLFTALLTLQDAELLYERALDDYGAGRFDQAITGFQKSYAISHAPGVLYNIGQAYRLKGDCTEAIKLYREYIQRETDTKNRKVAERQIQKCIIEQTIPNVRAEGKTTQADALAIPIAKTRADLDTLAASPVPSATNTRAKDVATPKSKTRSFVLALTGLALAATGSYLAISAGGDYDRLQMSCGHTCSPTTWDGLGAKEKLGYGLLVLGGVGVAGGVTLWIHDNSGGIAVGGRF